MRRAVVALTVLLSLAIPATALADPGPAPDPTAQDPTSQTATELKADGGPEALALGLSEADAAAMRRQTPLVAAATALEAAVGGQAAYTAIELTDRGLVLRWKGTPPSAVRAAISQLGVAVDIVAARYGQAELRQARDQLKAQIEAGRGNGIHAVSIPSDGSGLRLSVAPTQAQQPPASPAGPPAVPGPGGPTLQPASIQPTAGQRAAATKAIEAAGVTVATTVEVAASLTPMSRQNDFAPWAGGIVIVNRTVGSRFYGSRCTGGFGVRSASGTAYVVTASHCGDLGDTISDGGGETIGTISYRHPDNGVALIRASSISGEIYVGGATSQQSIRGVAGWVPPYKGLMLCASAAATGNICNLRVDSTQDLMCAIEAGATKCWAPLARVYHIYTPDAGQVGDSGGPMYYLSGSRAMIVGSIIGGDEGRSMWFVGSKTIEAAFDGVAPADSYDLSLNVATRSY